MSTQLSPSSTLFFDTATELSPTTQRTIPILLGKSNFRKWHAAIDPILLSNEQAHLLLSGTWTEPPSPRSPESQRATSAGTASPISPATPFSSSSSQSRLYTFLHAPSLSHASITTHASAHHAYEAANLVVCRFIRGTLAMNVVPFGRQLTSARSLYSQLIYLYGEKAGIDMVGGPAAFGAVNTAFQSRPLSSSRISEERDTSPILPVESSTNVAQDRRLTNDSNLSYGINVPRASNDPSVSTTLQMPITSPPKKKVAFKFTNTFPFRHSSTSSSTTPSNKTAYHQFSNPQHHPSTPAKPRPGFPHFSRPASHPHPHQRAKHPPPTAPAVSGLDFDLSYTLRRKASVAEDEGTQVEMKSMAANQDFDTAMEEEKESYFG